MDTPAPKFRLVHDGAKVLSLEPTRGVLSTPHHQFTGTLEACNAEIARLHLAPLPDPALAAAKAAKFATLGEKLRADLLAIFAGWTVGEQYDFDGARLALNADLEKGDLARAIAGVQTFRPADTSLEAHRTAVEAVLTAAAQKFAAVGAAQTVEAVNAVGVA